jgi:MurNAc alpha-1-phosphate uridylyltransferase
MTASPRAGALVLAAGRGERMRPLTDTCPKPLLDVRGRPLIQWHLEALVRGGVRDAVINTAWLGEQLPQRLGAGGEGSGMPRLHYSHEGIDFGGALETAGGISRALPVLDDVFWVVAGDVFMPGFAFSRDSLERFAAGHQIAHLWLVPNPAHNPRGDFGLSPDGLALNTADGPRHTYSTVGLYRAAFFDEARTGIAPGNARGIAAPLAPLLRSAMDNGQVSAELYTGPWTDVGTPERLAQLNTQPDPA